MSNRTRSAVWEFFSKTGNANLAKCHICCSILAYSGTTNLLKHLRARHSAETAAVMQWSTDDGQERTETDAAVEAMNQANAASELNDSGASGATISPRSGRKNRSLAWNCFRKIIGKNVAECLFCGVHISQEHGTTTCLMKHFMGKHPDVYAMHVEGQQEAVSFGLTKILRNAGTDDGTVMHRRCLCHVHRASRKCNRLPYMRLPRFTASHRICFSLLITKIHTYSTFAQFIQCRSDTLNFKYDTD